MKEVFIKCPMCEAIYSAKIIIKRKISISQCPVCLTIDGTERSVGITGYAEREDFKLFANGLNNGEGK